MKRILSLSLALALVLTLAGCGGEPVHTTTPTESVVTQPPHVHEYQISDTVGAGCVQGGYTVYVCDCTDSYHGDETEALGHSFGPWSTVKEPTETEEGEANRTCSVCGDIDLDSMHFAYSD